MAKKIITDQQGQRSYPGQITKIKGNIMATDGYGNIPLWVVPNVGVPKLIFPNTGNHHFPGATSFIEHPQMQFGGNVAESTGVSIRPDKLKINTEKLPVKIKSISVKQKQAELNRQLEERDYAQYVKGIENPEEINKYVSLLDPTGFMDINSIVESGIRHGTVNPTDVAGAAVNLIPGAKWAKKSYEPLKLLLNTAAKSGDLEDVINQEYKKGGSMKNHKNKGFEALPDYVQKHILANEKQNGGPVDAYTDFMRNGGEALMMGENLPVMQVGGSNLNPYQYAFDRYDKTGALTYDVAMPGRQSVARTNVDMKNLGMIPHPTIKGLYVKDGHVLGPHPNGQAYVNLGNVNDPKFNTPIKNQIVTPKVISNNILSTNNNFSDLTVNASNSRKPFVWGTNSNFDPNTNTYFTGASPNVDKSNIITPINESYGNNTPSLALGGENPFEVNKVNKFLKNFNKKFGGSNAPQGESLDEVVKQKNQDFIDYIANNTKAAMFREEANLVQKDFKQLGGPFGAYANTGIPDYVSDMKTAYDYPTVDSNYSTPSNLNLNSHGDNINNSVESKQNNRNDNNSIADFAMAGVQGLNKFFNNQQANKQKLFNQNKMTIENTVGTSYGSKGDYDVNSGNFRPNQKGMPFFKKGGSYTMNHKTIADLISNGYELQFLD